MAGTIHTNADKKGSSTLGVDVTKAYTTAEFALGTEVQLVGGAKYIFVLASEAITQYSVCLISSTHGIIELATGDVVKGRVCIPQIALASGEYGFALRDNGAGSVTSAASISAGAALTTTTTAGTVGAGGTTISGLTLTASSGGGGTTACFVNAPLAIL